MGGGWGLHSYFHVQPNNCVEVGLRFVVVAVVTIENPNGTLSSKIDPQIDHIMNHLCYKWTKHSKGSKPVLKYLFCH